VRGASAVATRSEGESESAERRERRGGAKLLSPANHSRERKRKEHHFTCDDHGGAQLCKANKAQQ